MLACSGLRCAGANPRYSARISCQPRSSADFPSLPLDGYLNNPDFHAIDTTFPGLQLVSDEPYIFIVPNFLNKDEAAELVEKMEQSTSQESPSSEKLLKLGDRTSSSVIPRNDEVPGIRSRIARLANVSPKQMQPLKITRYDEGGVFKRHTDCTVALDASGSYSPQQQPARFPNRCVSRCLDLWVTARLDSPARCASHASCQPRGRHRPSAGSAPC